MKTFHEPEIEVLKIRAIDVITTSDEFPDLGEDDLGWA